MLEFRERKPRELTDDELMRRWSKMDHERDHALYEEWRAYRAWLRESPLKDSASTRRLYLKMRGLVDNP